MSLLKLCTSCGAEKGVDEFPSNGRGGSRQRCVPCYQVYRLALPDYMLRKAFDNRKFFAKKNDIPFSISLSDLLPIPDNCPVLGIPLRHGIGGTTDGSPSIDRIVPSQGYVPGNVIVVSHKANRIKNDATPEELMAVAKFYAAL